MKLIKDSYNQISVHGKPLFIPISMIKGEYSKVLPKDYLNACKFFGITLIDRTQTLDDGIGFSVLDKMIYGSTEKSFEEISLERAENILNNALQTNRNIRLLWSGGIDSTTALLALYIKAKEKSCLEKIKVLLTKHSIDEFENFYTQIIQKELNYKLITPPIYTYMNPKEIMVTGELGDQLFGSDFLESYIKENLHNTPYENILPQIASTKLGSSKEAESMLNYLQVQIQKSPIAIVSLYDYIWWLNYSMKWQFVTFRILSRMIEQKIPYQIEDNMIHFFQNQDFQEWALRKNNFKIKEDWKSYKYIAKAFIHKYFEDEAYFIYKTKEQSLQNVSRNESFSFLHKEEV